MEGHENMTENILIWNGIGAGQYGPVYTGNILKTKYNVTYTKTISEKLLEDIKTFVLPGGNGGKVYLDNINGDILYNYVENGGNMYGTCAGGFAAAKRTDGWYEGWAIAPHICCKAPDHTGVIPIKFTGGSIINLDHWNGPAMYLEGGGEVLATYYDNATGYKNYAAIVGDKLGDGRVVLSGPHPELPPQHPEIVLNLIDYLHNDVEVMEFVIAQIEDAGSRVKMWMEEHNYSLPSTVTVKDVKVSLPQWLYLMTALLYSGSSVSLRSVTASNKTNETFKEGKIYESEYRNIAKNIKLFIESYGRTPKYATTSLGKMPFQDLVYNFSKIWNWMGTEHMPPAYVNCKQIGR